MNLEETKNKLLFKLILKWTLLNFAVNIAIMLLSPLKPGMEFNHYLNTFIYNTSLFSLLGCILLFFRKRYFYYAIYSALWIILSLANSMVVKFRGTSLTKYDFLMIQEGFSLGKDFMEITDFIFILIILAILTLILIKTYIYSRKMEKPDVNHCIVIVFLSLSCTFSLGSITKKNGDFDEIGFVQYAVKDIATKTIKKPSGYNKSKINSIKQEIDSKFKNIKHPVSDDKLNPNIIAIQLESFFDPKEIKGLKLNKNPIPFFDKLKDKYSHGMVHVPTFGGGTARTEYEFLTSMDLDNMSKGIIPHNTFLKNKVSPSMAYYLKESGYKTHFIHNYLGDFYNRDMVYRNLGFDTFTSKELIFYSSWDPLLIKASNDSVFAEEIKTILSKDDKRDFIFGVTAQLHGPYYSTYNAYENNIYAKGGFPKELSGEVNEYVNKIKTIDDAIKSIVTAVEEINEPSVIIFYSDHLPPLDFDSTNLKNKKYEAPYVVWDNIGLEREVKNLDISELSLEYQSKVNTNLSYLSKLYVTHKDSPKYNEYKKLVEYDVLFGNNYIKDREFEKINTKIGHKDIQVATAKKDSSGDYVFEGWNYTEYIKLVCDGKKYETIYEGPGKVRVKTSDDLVGKEAYLEISISDKSKSVAKSRKFVINS